MGLLDDISKLTTPATELPDLEDDNFDGSSLLKTNGNRSSKHARNFNFEEGKYAGSAISRKDIFGDISEISGLHGKVEDSDGSEDDEEVEEEEEDVDEDDVEMEGNVENSENSEEDSGDSDEDVDDEEEEEEEEGDKDDDDEEKEETSNLGMTTLSLKDDSDKADKATSVLHQRQVWDDLMYSNNRIHALLNTINQMPRGDSRKNLLKNCDESTRKSMEKAMENMGKLRNLMKNAIGIFDEKSGGREDSDDEEIPSDEEILSDFDEDEDDDDVDDDVDSDADGKNHEKAENRGTSVKSLKKNLETLDSSIDKFRASTVTKWYNRTKILNNSKSINSTDFSVFEKGSILGQINKVLADEGKLLKKVRTNRSGKPRIGAPEDVTNDGTIDNEIFDDSDFYQILLKQMLESRNQMSSHQEDGADMTRSYMELQSMFGNKKKRDVSQLSSKDRRLKYEPIAKLINFFPSKPSVVTWSHESRNELFKSLFT